MSGSSDKPIIIVADAGPAANGEAVATEDRTVERVAGVVAGYGAAIAADARTAAQLARELGTGAYYTQVHNGREYIIFRGRPGLRQTLRGTRYRATNPKVVELAVGRRGVASSARGTTGFVVVMFTAINVANWLLRDEFTLAHLLGYTTTDVTKAAISASAGYLVAAAVAGSSVAIVAVGPILIGLGVGIGVSYLLDVVDRELGITEALIGALQGAGDNIVRTIEEVRRDVNRGFHQFERDFIWHMTGGRMSLGSW